MMFLTALLREMRIATPKNGPTAVAFAVLDLVVSIAAYAVVAYALITFTDRIGP